MYLLKVEMCHFYKKKHTMYLQYRYMLGGVIVGSRGVAFAQHICTMNAITYLKNDALLDKPFLKTRLHHLYSIYIAIDYMCIVM